ncbi:hypothetical protein VP01_590g2 [Puccinia sorghi]|uniref:Uncharacterized protein n=1 Tax=Puccinia sorghi TaxID=27349 RepID=A0A0L6UHS4_9BASI|nr:hypothetical protein VP01_590g2 [Puccinia sorghi]
MANMNRKWKKFWTAGNLISLYCYMLFLKFKMPLLLTIPLLYNLIFYLMPELISSNMILYNTTINPLLHPRSKPKTWVIHICNLCLRSTMTKAIACSKSNVSIKATCNHCHPFWGGVTNSCCDQDRLCQVSVERGAKFSAEEFLFGQILLETCFSTAWCHILHRMMPYPVQNDVIVGVSLCAKTFQSHLQNNTCGHVSHISNTSLLLEHSTTILLIQSSGSLPLLKKWWPKAVGDRKRDNNERDSKGAGLTTMGSELSEVKKRKEGNGKRKKEALFGGSHNSNISSHFPCSSLFPLHIIISSTTFPNTKFLDLTNYLHNVSQSWYILCSIPKKKYIVKQPLRTFQTNNNSKKKE